MDIEDRKHLRWALLDENGKEIVNPVPHTVPVTPRPLSIEERIKRAVRTEISQRAQGHGMESFEESQDFDVHDAFESEEKNSKYVVMEEEFPTNLEEFQQKNSEESEPKGSDSGEKASDSAPVNEEKMESTVQPS